MNSDDNNVSTALTYDNFYKYFNGNDCLFGTNVDKLERRINEIDKCENLSEDVIIEKASCYSELGKDSNGNKKPKVCWTFVKEGTCIHTFKDSKIGRTISHLWHPGIEEKEYLKKK
jgi:hypothetical protein